MTRHRATTARLAFAIAIAFMAGIVSLGWPLPARPVGVFLEALFCAVWAWMAAKRWYAPEDAT